MQTFVLAQQPSGYFVLNDVLRYINEDVEDEAPEPSAQTVTMPAEPEATAAAAAEDTTEQAVLQQSDQESSTAQLDPAVVNKKLEEVSAAEKESPSASATDTPAESAPEVQETTPAQVATAPESAPVPDPDTAARELAEEDAKKTEAPKDPTPTPVAARSAAPVAAEPEKPKEPPKPMTWASRAAAAAAAAGPPRPAVPLPKTATPPAPTQSRVVPVTNPAVASQTGEVAAPSSKPANKENVNEWQTAGADSKRQSRPLSISGPPPEKDGTLAYIRNVTDKIQSDDLRAALAEYGELKYFDVNRQKVRLPA